MRNFKKILSTMLALAILAGIFGYGDLPALAVGDVKERVSMGLCHAMALNDDGSLWVWGSNGKGYWSSVGYPSGGGILGVTQDTEEHKPIKIMDNVASFSSGGWHALAIKKDKTLWAWGNNKNGELGDGTTASKTKPVKIMDDVMSVSAGSYHSMAIKSDGSLWAWGKNDNGLIGDGTCSVYERSPENRLGIIVENHDKKTPVKIMDNVVYAFASANVSAAIKKDGSLWMWGIGSYNSSVPLKIMDNAVSVAAYGGECEIMVIKKDGSLWGRGQNVNGGLGDGTANRRDSFVKIMDSVAKVSVGWKYTMAIKKDGTLWGWGYNEKGQLGDGTTKDKHSPVKIMADVSSVAAGPQTTIAVKTDGSVWTWGFSEAGILGDDIMKDRSKPEKITVGKPIQTPTNKPTPTPANKTTPAPTKKLISVL